MTRVFVHGFAGLPGTWSALAQPGDSLVTLPGHGAEPPPTASFSECAETLAAALPRACHLVGYSMGGRLALAAAMTRPEALTHLTLVSAHAGIRDLAERSERDARDRELAARIEVQGIDWFARTWAAMPMWQSQERAPLERRVAQDRQRRSHRPQALARALRLLGPGAMPDLWPALAALRTPTTLVCGELDERYVALAHEMAERLPNARVVVVSGAGHNPILEDPEAVAAALAADDLDRSAEASA